MSTAMSQYILNTVARYDLSSKCVAFTGDNGNVNFGGVRGKDDKNVFS